MNSAALLVAVGFFIILVFASFAIQIYIATRVYETGWQKVIGSVRGTRTFIRGWQSAKAMDLTGIMTIWSFLVVLLIIWIIPIAYLGARGDIASTTTTTNSAESVPLPTLTPITFDEPICGITFPQEITNLGGVISIDGFVNIAPQYLESWELHFYPEGRPQEARMLREPSNIPSPQGTFFILGSDEYPAGTYTADLIVTLKNVPNSTPNPCRHTVTFTYRG